MAFDVKLDAVKQELHPDFCWFHPRVAAIPGAGREGRPAVVMTLQKHLGVSDHYSGLWMMRTDDLGQTWKGSRPFSLIQGLLRPALQVLGRELANQYSSADPRRDRGLRDGDVEFLLETGPQADAPDSDDLQQLISAGTTRLSGILGALLVPDKQIAISHPAGSALQAVDRELLEKTQRNLLAWVQVQRRTLMLNRVPANSPLGTLPYKILACPLRDRTQQVIGILVLFQPLSAADFDLRHVRAVEMMARHLAYVLQNTFDPSTGLFTRPAFEQRALALLAAGVLGSEHCVAYGDVDRLHRRRRC